MRKILRLFLHASAFTFLPFLSTSLAASSIEAGKQALQMAIDDKTKALEEEKKSELELEKLQQQCSKEKLDLLNTMVNDLKSLEKPIADLKQKYEQLREEQIGVTLP